MPVTDWNSDLRIALRALNLFLLNGDYLKSHLLTSTLAALSLLVSLSNICSLLLSSAWSLGSTAMSLGPVVGDLPSSRS